ncbi:TetR/AcrR family transcriptional regulator [Saccharibacillus brassicae]|uniref:TetR/AcrR family transcriptional regulator n=1 Tax=Saccharibacillus brassicae TaxID=2583377 RepID=A0A4Y6UX83_SACBS|nr:TetR/AcrR family transcriptional regulator [Saccharibacillus brassicae]QDH22323.1 TetR/AcrR family transcriptional regulator [Saccharibacillus brassicae]
MAVVDRREQVLHAAAQSFSLFGYKATTMDQVAKIANVGKGTIYTFFENKEELFDEILLDAIRELRRRAEAEIHAERPFYENVYQALDAILEFREEHELFIKLSQELRDIGTPQARAALFKVESVVLEFLERIIRESMDKGAIRSGSVEVIAFGMLKLFIALTGEWEMHHEPMTKEELKRHMFTFLTEGFTAAP